MPEEQTKVVQSKMPRELPMPRYEYQRPASGNYTSKYDEKKVRDQSTKKDEAPALQHVKLAV